MEPNQFRESRQAINRLCDNISSLIDQNAVEASKDCYKEVNDRLEALIPQAEGEIQERSVKNLGTKLRMLSGLIGKLKPKKAPFKKGESSRIVWDEERVAQLSDAFLRKVFTNMGDDSEALVYFGTTGKGIRPNYQIHFGKRSIIPFNGSSHKPGVKKISSNTGKLSPAFSREVIEKILKKG